MHRCLHHKAARTLSFKGSELHVVFYRAISGPYIITSECPEVALRAPIDLFIFKSCSFGSQCKSIASPIKTKVIKHNNKVLHQCLPLFSFIKVLSFDHCSIIHWSRTTHSVWAACDTIFLHYIFIWNFMLLYCNWTISGRSPKWVGARCIKETSTTKQCQEARQTQQTRKVSSRAGIRHLRKTKSEITKDVNIFFLRRSFQNRSCTRKQTSALFKNFV